MLGRLIRIKYNRSISWWFSLVDHWCRTIILYCVGLRYVKRMNCCYIFHSIHIVIGVDNLCDDISIMLGENRRPGKFWKICWQYVSPLILVVINLVLNLLIHEIFDTYVNVCLVLLVHNYFLIVILSRSNTG